MRVCACVNAHVCACACAHVCMYVLGEDPFALAGIFHAANRHQLQIHWPGLSEALLICTFAN